MENRVVKKVLILCDAFPPAFAPRMGYLCKYLKNSCWEPTVVAEAVPGDLFSFLTNTCPVHFVNFYKRTSKWNSKLEWVFVFLADLLFRYKDYRMAKIADKLIKQESFDLILCSTYRTFPLPTALKLAKKHRLPFIADNRDIIEQYPGNEFMNRKISSKWGLDKIIVPFFRKKLLKQRNKALQKANCVITISPWHVDSLKKINANIKLIYNGFDPELFYPKHIRTPRFTIIYTGRLISTAIGNPELLFQALEQLSNDNIFSPDNCSVKWYVDSKSERIIRQEVEKYNIAKFMEYHPFVPASQIPLILNQASILLILCNKSSGVGLKGMMSTKFFEALGVEKPVLCVKSDEDCLEATIRETNAGLAGRNVKEVYQFLQGIYQQWKKQGYTSANIHKELLFKYSRKEQANQFIQIFNQTINKLN